MRRTVFIGTAIVAVSLAVIITPARLASVGIMDNSLAADSELTRNTAQATIAVGRLGLIALAVALAALALFIRRIEASPWFTRRLSEGSAFPEVYERRQRRLLSPTASIALVALVAAILYLMSGGGSLDQLTLNRINKEDGLLESMSALMLLITSGIALSVSRSIHDPAGRWMHGVLAIVFFAMFGEEISWGQRLLGFGTPEALARVNVQNETNLHNSYGYLFDHLFILGFFVWGCLVPLLYWSEPIWRWHQSRLGLPYPSIGLALAMLGVTLVQPQITRELFGGVPGLREAELRETLSALCLMLLMLESQALTSPRAVWKRRTPSVP